MPEAKEALLRSYLNLHDRLSDMIESGRLKEADIPDDYAWLVESLASLAALSDAAGMPAPNTQEG